MLLYLINNTQTLLPFGLALALVFARLYHEGQKKRPFGIGLLIGTLCAIGLALLRLNTPYIIRELYNAPLLLLILVSIFIYTIFNLSHAFFLFVLGFTFSAFFCPNLILYPFEFNVGMDTFFNTVLLEKSTGYSGALILIGVTFWALYKLMVQFEKPFFKNFLKVGFFLLWLYSFLLSLQIVVLRGWIKSSALTSFVSTSLQYQEYLLFALLALCIWGGIQAILQQKAKVFTGENAALVRKEKIAVRRQYRFAMVVMITSVLFFAILTGGVAIENHEVELAPPLEIEVKEEKIHVPIANVDDGHLHRFAYTAKDGTEMRYIIIKKGAGSFGVALDACDVCGASGYYERDGLVVCSLCDVVMNISTIGFKGGCNPVPLPFVIKEGAIVIRTPDLDEEAYRFR